MQNLFLPRKTAWFRIRRGRFRPFLNGQGWGLPSCQRSPQLRRSVVRRESSKVADSIIGTLSRRIVDDMASKCECSDRVLVASPIGHRNQPFGHGFHGRHGIETGRRSPLRVLRDFRVPELVWACALPGRSGETDHCGNASPQALRRRRRSRSATSRLRAARPFRRNGATLCCGRASKQVYSGVAASGPNSTPS